MKIGEQLFLAIKAYGLAFRNLDKFQIWRLIILPSLLSLVIAILVGLLAWITADDILLFVNEKLKIDDPDHVYSLAIELTIAFIVRGATLFLYLKLYRYLVLIFLSPVFVTAARILREKADGKRQVFSIWKYCFCSWRGIKLALRNLLFELILTILIMLLSIIILWISPLLPFFMLLIESYYFGMVMMDYNYEMKGYSRQESSLLISNNFGYALGNGLIFNLALLIPLLGVIFAPILSLTASFSGIELLNNEIENANPIPESI